MSGAIRLDAATIFCGKPEPNIAVRAIRSCVPESDTSVTVEPHIELNMPVGRLAFVLRLTGEDNFSSVILGMHNYFSGIETRHGAIRERVLDLIERCGLMIGTRADPAMSFADSRWRCVLTVAEKTAGMVFDGSSIRDAEGRVLLGPDGETEVERP